MVCWRICILNIIPKMCRSHAPLSVRKTLWVFYLAVALVFIQGARLHVHIYNGSTRIHVGKF